jgi:RNA polymerase sigma-70 factor (ECF subfamily)
MAGQEGQGRQAALSELLTRYLPAMKAHLVRRKGISPDSCDDLLQAFVADKVLEQQLIGRAACEKGKFRTFLLTALERYVLNRIRHDKAKKRCPAGKKELDAEELASPQSADPFDEAWAREVIREALRRMEAECQANGRMDVWGVFHCRTLAPTLEGSDALPYAQVVQRFGFRSPIQASNALITAKRMYLRMLCSVVGEYCHSPEGIEAEIEDLKAILSRCGA